MECYLRVASYPPLKIRTRERTNIVTVSEPVRSHDSLEEVFASGVWLECDVGELSDGLHSLN